MNRDIASDASSGRGIRQRLDQLLNVPPEESYDDIAKRLREARKLFHECVADQIEKPLRQQMASMRHASYEEKKEVASWVNKEMRELGLAVRCPNTGEPSQLRVGPGKNPETGRFRIMPYLTKDRATFSSVEMFDISVMPYAERFFPRPGRSWDR